MLAMELQAVTCFTGCLRVRSRTVVVFRSSSLRGVEVSRLKVFTIDFQSCCQRKWLMEMMEEDGRG